ncbi:hypothetical protein BE20_01160 [Sorangium cellulosum]|nr:hypothetical protein BE20_01160 [Sorangium cellulosum]
MDDALELVGIAVSGQLAELFQAGDGPRALGTRRSRMARQSFAWRPPSPASTASAWLASVPARAAARGRACPTAWPR